jgi:hypothetical protein
MCLLWSTNLVLISQKTTFFIVTDVKNSNFTNFFCFVALLDRINFVNGYKSFFFFFFFLDTVALFPSLSHCFHKKILILIFLFLSVCGLINKFLTNFTLGGTDLPTSGGWTDRVMNQRRVGAFLCFMCVVCRQLLQGLPVFPARSVSFCVVVWAGYDQTCQQRRKFRPELAVDRKFVLTPGRNLDQDERRDSAAHMISRLLHSGVTPLQPIVTDWWQGAPTSDLCYVNELIIWMSTRRHIPEDYILHSHRRENLKSYIALTG